MLSERYFGVKFLRETVPSDFPVRQHIHCGRRIFLKGEGDLSILQLRRQRGKEWVKKRFVRAYFSGAAGERKALNSFRGR